MGANQLLYIVLGFIIIGASIRVGINQYQAYEVEQNRDALMSKIQSIALDAFTYRVKSVNLGAKKDTYVGFKLSKKGKSDDAGSYKASIAKDKITITGTSSRGFGTIVIAFDKYGKYVKKSYKVTGIFKKKA